MPDLDLEDKKGNPRIDLFRSGDFFYFRALTAINAGKEDET